MARAIIARSAGKYKLPNGWSYKRIGMRVLMMCGQRSPRQREPFVVPVDIFVDMDRDDIREWIDECREKLRTEAGIQ
jgi:hypothetical protein